MNFSKLLFSSIVANIIHMIFPLALSLVIAIAVLVLLSQHFPSTRFGPAAPLPAEGWRGAGRFPNL